MSFKRVFTGIALCSSMATTSSLAEPDNALWAIPISGYFSADVVNDVINQIENLRDLDPARKITIEFFDVHGGEIKPGFDLAQALYDAGNLDVVCRGNLQSMGATVFASYQGDGDRIAAEDCSNFMFHDLIIGLWAPHGTARLVRTYATELSANLEEATNIMILGTSKAANIPQESAAALFGEDCNLSPEEAFRLGLIDRFETATTLLPQRLNNPTPDDIYAICGTAPLAGRFPMEDWSGFTFMQPRNLAMAGP